MVNIARKSKFKKMKKVDDAAFANGRREKLLDYKTYAAEADDLLARIVKTSDRLADPIWCQGKDTATILRMTGARAEYALNLLALQYSAGMPVESLPDAYVKALNYFEVYAKVSSQYNQEQGASYRSPHITLGNAEFVNANRLVCFAILLGCINKLGRVASIIDYDCPARDGMLERLLGQYLQGRQNSLECTRRLPYSKTLKIFDAQDRHRPEMLSAYLAEWYADSRLEPYYESCKRGNGFTGYWSWEAAAITFILDIDDTDYRTAPFYPRDLVDFARQAGNS